MIDYREVATAFFFFLAILTVLAFWLKFMMLLFFQKETPKPKLDELDTRE